MLDTNDDNNNNNNIKRFIRGSRDDSNSASLGDSHHKYMMLMSLYKLHLATYDSTTSWRHGFYSCDTYWHVRKFLNSKDIIILTYISNKQF
jgi:hypothetical protein